MRGTNFSAWLVVSLLAVALPTACHRARPHQSAHANAAKWLAVVSGPGYPAPGQQVPPTVVFALDNAGLLSRTEDGVDGGNIVLSKAQMDVLRRLTSSVHGPSRGSAVDAPYVALFVYEPDGTSVEICALPSELNSAPVQAQARLEQYFSVRTKLTGQP
jgi:hypothetical protein